VLNVYATRDHIVPPAATRRLRSLLAHDEYTEHAFDGGHIGVFTSRRARGEVPRRVCEWYTLSDR
jgi:polyhydroxyalkanoate synthase